MLSPEESKGLLRLLLGQGARAARAACTAIIIITITVLLIILPII